MTFEFRPLDRAGAGAISAWHYDPPYDFYDLTADPDDLHEFNDESRWGTTLFGAYDSDELVGYVGLTAYGDVMEIGLGLRPDLTGRGIGAAFMDAILEFARRRFNPRTFRLKVARFNARAIRTYERTGFTPTREFMQETNGGSWPFVEMSRPA